MKSIEIINSSFKEFKTIKNKKEIKDFQIISFPQTWGNTSGGFEGAGGCMMTTETTVIFYNDFTREVYVFFKGKFAYKMDKVTPKFVEDLKNWRIAGVNSKSKYL